MGFNGLRRFSATVIEGVGEGAIVDKVEWISFLIRNEILSRKLGVSYLITLAVHFSCLECKIQKRLA